jgi:hypothetical protein
LTWGLVRSNTAFAMRRILLYFTNRIIWLNYVTCLMYLTEIKGALYVEKRL